jgi:hypothetical protein
VLSGLVDVAPADMDLVSGIEAALLQASQAYTDRKYRGAIDSYLQAQSLLYSHIDSGCVLGAVERSADLPRDSSLFDPLLSASLEWLNVLPVAGPVSPVRPRVAVPAAPLAALTAIQAVGVSTPTLSRASGMQAAADLHLAETMTTLGNTAAASFLTQRAGQTDADAVKAIRPPAAAGAAPAPPLHLASAEFAPAAAVLTAAHLPAVAGPIYAPVTVTPIVNLPPAATVTRSVGALIQGRVTTVSWTAGSAAALDAVKSAVYVGRPGAPDLNDAISAPALASDLILSIPHNYFYVIPLGLAQSYQALGDWTHAEQFYLRAAGYTYLNAAVEVPYLWIQLANLYLEWGDQLYRSGDVTNALPVYEKVLAVDSTAPTSGPLFATASLSGAAASARQVITNLTGLIADPTTITTLKLNPQMAAVILQVHQRLVQIAAGLDFWGHWAPRVPIWTFDYLQQVAINFAQLAVSAEQQVISFWDRADQGQLTRLQLTQQVSQAQAEVAAAAAQTQAALAQQSVYQDGVNLARQRAADAQANANQYQATSSAAIVHQALQSQLSGGDDGNSDVLNNYANAMMSGSYDFSDSRATLAAAEQLTAARFSQQYEVASLQRQANELNAAQAQAQAELTASAAQVNAARAAQAVASLKASRPPTRSRPLTPRPSPPTSGRPWATR